MQRRGTSREERGVNSDESRTAGKTGHGRRVTGPEAGNTENMFLKYQNDAMPKTGIPHQVPINISQNDVEYPKGPILVGGTSILQGEEGPP